MKRGRRLYTDLIYYRCLIRSRRVARMAEQAGLATPCRKDRVWALLIQRKY